MLEDSGRSDLRAVFFRAWQRRREGPNLQGVDRLVVEVANMHPEYHPILDAPQQYLEHDFADMAGQENPFLHMAMHISLLEQLGVDRPPGVCGLYRGIAAKAGNVHEAQHIAMECLAEVLHASGHSGQPPSEAAYLACLARAASP